MYTRPLLWILLLFISLTEGEHFNFMSICEVLVQLCLLLKSNLCLPLPLSPLHLFTITTTVCVPALLREYEYDYEYDVYEEAKRPENCSTAEGIRGGRVTYSEART